MKIILFLQMHPFIHEYSQHPLPLPHPFRQNTISLSNQLITTSSYLSKNQQNCSSSALETPKSLKPRPSPIHFLPLRPLPIPRPSINFIRASIIIMKLQGQSSAQDQPQSNSRFLIRHSSSSVLNLFGCCSSSTSNEYQSHHAQKPHPNKISIKNVLKKSAIFPTNTNLSACESQSFLHDRRTANITPSSISPHRKNSHFSQTSQSFIKNHSERTIPTSPLKKANLVYNKEESDNSVHNYHTTNYIVEKYIVNPQEMNIFVKGEQERQRQQQFDRQQSMQEMERFRQGYGRNRGSNQLFQGNSLKAPLPKEEISSNNCHFSFGQQQKKFFMSQFAGFREVCSNRPSKQSANLQSSSEQSKIQQLPTTFSSPNFLKRKQTLNNLVRDVFVMDQEQDSHSDKSQVIDSYQTIMSRIQERSRTNPSQYHAI